MAKTNTLFVALKFNLCNKQHFKLLIVICDLFRKQHYRLNDKYSRFSCDIKKYSPNKLLSKSSSVKSSEKMYRSSRSKLDPVSIVEPITKCEESHMTLASLETKLKVFEFSMVPGMVQSSFDCKVWSVIFHANQT